VLGRGFDFPPPPPLQGIFGRKGGGRQPPSEQLDNDKKFPQNSPELIVKRMLRPPMIRIIE